MSRQSNIFGLTRHIPNDVKREVRRKCGYGCIVCGSTIYEYEHVDPPYAIARTHEVDRIVLLCPKHHAIVTKGLMSKQALREWITYPAAKRVGFSKENYPYFRGIPVVFLGGGLILKNVPVVVNICGYEPLSFGAPPRPSEPISISARFFSPEGTKVLEVNDNEWRVLSGNWDFECKGNRYIFKYDNSKPFLVLRIESPFKIAIERMSINSEIGTLIVNEKSVSFKRKDGYSKTEIIESIVSDFYGGLFVDRSGRMTVGF